MELLFVVGGTDRRGKRVIIRDGQIENVIFPEEIKDDQTVNLILDKKQKMLIQRFFAEYGKVKNER